jgi:hypothetical protein
VSELHVLLVSAAISAIATTISNSNSNGRPAHIITIAPSPAFSAKNGRRCLRALASIGSSDRAGAWSTLRSSLMTFTRHHILSSSTRGSLCITAESKRRSVSRGKRKYKTCCHPLFCSFNKHHCSIIKLPYLSSLCSSNNWTIQSKNSIREYYKHLQHGSTLL